MLFAFLYTCLRLMLDLADVRLRRGGAEAELLPLRHELRVLRREVRRPRLRPSDRAVMAAFSRRVARQGLAGLVRPETVVGWHRELVRRKWVAFGRPPRAGRPRIDPEVRELIVRMAKENSTWGCVRIRGELVKLGHRVSATAIRQLLRRERLGAGAAEIEAELEVVLEGASIDDRASATSSVWRPCFCGGSTSLSIWSWPAGGSSGSQSLTDRTRFGWASRRGTRSGS